MDRAGVNAQGGYYGNALQAAAYSGNVEAIQLLLDEGANVNEQGGEYGNALQAATYKGNLAAMQLLLDRGADVGAQGGKYGNALQAAASNGNVEAMRLLLGKARGVSVHELASSMNLLELQDCKGGKPSTSEALTRNSMCTARGMAPDTITTLPKPSARASQLLGTGVNIQAQCGYMLQEAAYGGNVMTLRHLLNQGADVNAQGGRWGNALQTAMINDKIEAMRLLLDNGAEVNAKGGEYGNALQGAAYKGNVEAIQLLLDRGADVNARGRYGTALEAAAYNPNSDNVEARRVLMDKGVKTRS